MNSIRTGVSTLRMLLAVVVLLGIGATPSQAADTWYQVEVLVFAQRHPDSGNELWPENPGTPNMTNVLEVPASDSNDSQLRPLPAQEFRLKDEEQKLLASDHYELLLHTGWRQPGLLKELAFPVHIHTPLPIAPMEDGMAPAQPAPLRLDGVINLSLARYLHLDVDLLYRAAADEHKADDSGFFGTTAPVPPQVYRLQESRRMRSKELHYLDHPMFGVIALVTPYELAQAPVAPTPAVSTAAPALPNGTTGAIRRN